MQVPAKQWFLSVQTSVDGFKEAKESCAETPVVSMYLKLGLQMGKNLLSGN